MASQRGCAWRPCFPPPTPTPIRHSSPAALQHLHDAGPAHLPAADQAGPNPQPPGRRCTCPLCICTDMHCPEAPCRASPTSTQIMTLSGLHAGTPHPPAPISTQTADPPPEPAGPPSAQPHRSPPPGPLGLPGQPEGSLDPSALLTLGLTWIPCGPRPWVAGPRPQEVVDGGTQSRSRASPVRLPTPPRSFHSTASPPPRCCHRPTKAQTSSPGPCVSRVLPRFPIPQAFPPQALLSAPPANPQPRVLCASSC